MDGHLSRRRFLVGCGCATAGVAAAGGVVADRGPTARRDPPPTRWNRVYDSAGDAPAVAVVPAADDDGFVLAGTVADTEGDNDRVARLLKVDPAGEVVWERTYSLESTTVANDALALDDGYVFVGNTRGDPDAGQDGFAVEVDADGAVRWENTFWVNVDSTDAVNAVASRDGGYLCAGETDVFDDGWVVALDADGSTDWKETYNGGGVDRFNAVVGHPDGGYVAAGASPSSSEDTQAWLARIDEDGNRIWDRFHRKSSDSATNPYDDYNEFFDIQPSTNGFVVVGANAFDPDRAERRGWVAEVNEGGGIIWDKRYEEDRFTEFRAIAIGDLQYYVVGRTAADSNGTDARGYAAKVGIRGNVQWSNTYTGQGSDLLRDVALLGQDELVGVGTTAESSDADRNHWGVKVGGEPTGTPTPTPTPTPTESPTPSPTPIPATPVETTTGGGGGGGVSPAAIGVGLVIVALGAGGYLYNQFARRDDKDVQVAGPGPGTGGSAPLSDDETPDTGTAGDADSGADADRDTDDV